MRGDPVSHWGLGPRTGEFRLFRSAANPSLRQERPRSEANRFLLMSDIASNITPPTGTVTLMFTDIEGSSGMWDRLQMRFRPILDTHNRLLREVFTRWGGYEV